jgi:hypothetical protein
LIVVPGAVAVASVGRAGRRTGDRSRAQSVTSTSPSGERAAAKGPVGDVRGTSSDRHDRVNPPDVRVSYR